MRLAALAVLALSLTLSFAAGEAAAQTCKEDDPCLPCVVAGERGSRCCVNGKFSACIPELNELELCGGKDCTGGKVCVNDTCVCDAGFTDCDGTCRDLIHDTFHCGSCTNACPTGTSCRPAAPVVLGALAGVPNVTAAAGVCTCIPPTVGCGGVCRNPTNDPSNCGSCGRVCSAPTSQCRSGQCVAPDAPPSGGGAGSTGNLPLDLFWSATDPNGIPVNPDWRARTVPALVDNEHLVVEKACPQCFPTPQCVSVCVSSGANSPACRACLPRESCWRQCTKFPVTSDGGLFCGASHINWIPATYTGTLVFDDYSARGFLSSIVQDDDYTFNLTPPNHEGLAGRSRLHPEMSFLETVEDFESTFWTNFRHAVEQVPGDDLSGPRALFDKPAIVIGLQGLDTQHGAHEELHPIWAMALRRAPADCPVADPLCGAANPTNDCWAVFARNWGNQGFCSNHQHFLQRDRITFRLPQPGATAVTETSREFDTNSGATAVSQVGLVQGGAEITFFLGRPEDRTYVDGEFCLRWALRPGTPPPPLQFAALPDGPEEPDVDLEQHPGVELLTRAQIDQIGRSSTTAPPPHKPRPRRAPKRVPFVPSSARPPAAGTLVTARKGPVDAKKQAHEREIHRLVCDALRGRPDRPKLCDQP